MSCAQLSRTHRKTFHFRSIAGARSAGSTDATHNGPHVIDAMNPASDQFRHGNAMHGDDAMSERDRQCSGPSAMLPRRSGRRCCSAASRCRQTRSAPAQPASASAPVVIDGTTVDSVRARIRKLLGSAARRA